MTYLEILEWIESHSCEVWSFANIINIEYYSEYRGERTIAEGKDLISIVLEINGKELVK